MIHAVQAFTYSIECGIDANLEAFELLNANFSVELLSSCLEVFRSISFVYFISLGPEERHIS